MVGTGDNDDADIFDVAASAGVAAGVKAGGAGAGVVSGTGSAGVETGELATGGGDCVAKCIDFGTET